MRTQRRSSEVTMSTPLMRLSQNSSGDDDSGNLHPRPLITTSFAEEDDMSVYVCGGVVVKRTVWRMSRNDEWPTLQWRHGLVQAHVIGRLAD